MLRNHLFLCNLLFFSASFQTLYAPKAVSAKRPIKALKLPTKKSMIQLDLPQKSFSISPQLLAGCANAQFGKTQFFETPCTVTNRQTDTPLQKVRIKRNIQTDTPLEKVRINVSNRQTNVQLEKVIIFRNTHIIIYMSSSSPSALLMFCSSCC